MQLIETRMFKSCVQHDTVKLTQYSHQKAEFILNTMSLDDSHAQM